MKEIKITDIAMRINILYRLLLLIFIFSFVNVGFVQAQTDNMPVREYTNPEEMVSFDRTTSFARAVDVINDFSQQFRDKPVLDRTNTEGNIGIAVAPKHWMDALKLILRVKELQLVERPDFYEIVKPQKDLAKGQPAASGGGQQQDGEGPIVTTATKEVLINAIFFEGNRRALQEIGVDWTTISEDTPEDVIDAGEEGVQVPSSEFGDGPFVQVNSEGASNVSQRVFESVINFGEIGNSGISVQSLFSAFEADNLGEILSSPTVKVMDGQEGRIQVGQDFSVKQRDFAGNVVEEFFSVGTILEVTPQIIEQNDTTFVHLTISAERSSAQPDPVSTVINKQQAETQALLLDGQATVLAGLYRTEHSEVRRGVPILKDLPAWFFGLRYLFGFTSNDYLMRELVILLQVSIEPTIPERMNEGVITNKFESLQEQREQNRRDIEQGDRIFSGKSISESLDIEADQNYEPKKEKIGNGSEKTEPKLAPEDSQVESKQGKKTEKPKQKEGIKEDNLIKDPEVPEVELNLGGAGVADQPEAEQPTEEKAVTDKSPQQNDSKNKQNDRESTFYIIGGSFSETDNANKLKNKLQAEGFNALLLERSGKGVTYVAYQAYNDIDTARSALDDIRQYQNSDAWLYIPSK